MSCVLGLDVSTKTGFCVLSKEGTLIEKGEASFKTTGLSRAGDFYDFAVAMYTKHIPALVMIENYGFANAYTLGTLVEVGTAVRLGLRACNAKITLVPPTVLKKFVTGTGLAKKEQMLLSIYKRWGVEFASNNEADAYALARMAMAHMGYEGVTKGQQELLSKVSMCT
jgi:crossover junction endodeoxyribonuclease RuvC